MKKIMFSDKYGLTKAVLEGRKTQTRRIISFSDTYDDTEPRYRVNEEIAIAQSYKDILGEENLSLSIRAKVIMLVEAYSKGIYNKMFIRADLMPHRIKMTNIRIERLQDISDEDCLKEGVRTDGYQQKYYTVSGFKKHFSTPQEAFACLIDRVCVSGTWERNPWVFVYDFELVR